MLTNMKEMLNTAKREKYAVPHFNINNLEWTKFILQVAEEERAPVILGVSESAIQYMGGYVTVSKTVEGLLSDLKITIPVVLHLDHGHDLISCKKAIDAGFTSVMIDASKKALEENIKETKEVVLYAEEKNVSVEAEIGHIGIGEASQEEYANIEECQKFVLETKVDALAPALGSAHGLYKGLPHLDFIRMKEIAEITGIPLVLHGGTGIADSDLQNSIQNGICKININTELQVVWAQAVRTYLTENETVYDPRKIIASGEKAMKEMIRYKLKVLKNQKQ
ncbi:MAG: class II fructose-1,6-bisphosphate aldolase [Bacilli bacterium]|nr:class II fructose-1,6-bisphosphate aldolase [Bacilli bacterium]